MLRTSILKSATRTPFLTNSYKYLYLGAADEKLDTLTVSGLEVRMHAKEEVELFLLARGDGMTVRDAAAFAGVGMCV